MKYSDLTINDPNPIKRYLQRSRFNDAVAFYPKNADASIVLDFGGGDGELCLRLANNDPKSNFICYEPDKTRYAEAKEKIASSDRVSLSNSLGSMAPESVDIIYALEVFEHLPKAEFDAAINRIFSILKPGGTLIIGVPNELFAAAIYKGLFRMFRRFGEFDARLKNILKCAIGRPPPDRPESEISPGKKYHLHHLGFDHRVLKGRLTAESSDLQRVCRPFRFAGAWGNPEIYYLVKKAKTDQRKT